MRFTAYSALLTFAAKNDDSEIVASSLPQLPHWLTQWEVSQTQKEEILSQVSNLLSEYSGNATQAYAHHLLYVRFLSNSKSSKAKAAVEKLIADAVRLHSVFEFGSLLEIDAVQQLKAEPIGQLLTVLTEGNHKDVQTWWSKHEAEATRLNIPKQQLERKARLLDLADLCAKSVSKEIPYAQIAQTIDATEDDVELWVIDGESSRLLFLNRWDSC